MLNLPKRLCLLGVPNIRREKHGDEEVTAFDIPITDLMIDRLEFNALLQEPQAHAYFFNTGHAPAEPLYPSLGDLTIREKIEAASVTLFIGVDEEQIRLADVNLKGVTIARKIGGLCALSFKIQCTPALNKSLNHLLENLNSGISAEVQVDGYGDQAQLPMGQAA